MVTRQTGNSSGKEYVALRAPHSGPDHRAGGDQSVLTQARHARRITRHIERHLVPTESDTRYSPGPVIDALAAVTMLASVVERWRAELARLARRRGAKWSEIGCALGVSRQAAHERYRR